MFNFQIKGTYGYYRSLRYGTSAKTTYTFTELNSADYSTLEKTQTYLQGLAGAKEIGNLNEVQKMKDYFNTMQTEINNVNDATAKSKQLNAFDKDKTELDNLFVRLNNISDSITVASNYAATLDQYYIQQSDVSELTQKLTNIEGNLKNLAQDIGRHNAESVNVTNLYSALATKLGQYQQSFGQYKNGISSLKVQ